MRRVFSIFISCFTRRHLYLRQIFCSEGPDSPLCPLPHPAGAIAKSAAIIFSSTNLLGSSCVAHQNLHTLTTLSPPFISTTPPLPPSLSRPPKPFGFDMERWLRRGVEVARGLRDAWPKDNRFSGHGEAEVQFFWGLDLIAFWYFWYQPNDISFKPSYLIVL